MASKLTIALAGLAFASLPVFVDAQGTSTPQTRPEQPTTTSQQSRAGRADQNSPQHHLDEAKRVITSINANSVQGESRSQVNELKRHFTQLETAWRASSAGAARTGASRSTGGTGATTGTTTGSATGTTSGTTTGSATGSATGTTQGTTGSTSTTAEQGRYGRGASAAGGDWMTHYNAINTLLDQMIGSGTSASMSGTTSTTSGTSSGTTGSTTGTSSGTTGSATERTGSAGSAGASTSASARIEGDTRTKLTEFKRHLDQFHTTAMAQRAPGGEDASAASRSMSAPATTSHETPEATAATGTASTSGTSSTMTGTAGTTGSTQTSQPPSSTTQTPQTTSSAQQTSASATIDSAAIARLTASIDEMLRGGASTSTTAGTATSATGTTTSGTVGTSGSTSATGTVCVDRAKLEALKTQLQALQNRPR